MNDAEKLLQIMKKYQAKQITIGELQDWFFTLPLCRHFPDAHVKELEYQLEHSHFCVPSEMQYEKAMSYLLPMIKTLERYWYIYLSNNDNEINTVYPDEAEYIIEINLWNGDVYRLRTVRCERVNYNDNLVGEIGDITISENSYLFKTVDNENIILEVIAEDIQEVIQ